MPTAFAEDRASYVPRTLQIADLLRKHTVFLFGPRQTGKSTLVRHELGADVALTFNLLDRSLLLRLLANPSELRQEIEGRDLRNAVVCIDEIQKCPALLDEVHLLIEERGIRFLLTGSSARKLRRAGTNLLGGRGRDRSLHPFTYHEVKNFGFSLDRAINFGLIPGHFFADDADDALESYVTRYLTEEVSAEGIARNIPAFARFLQVAATANAQLINATSIGSDAQVSRQTVQNYFQILKDTLIGHELAPFGKTIKRKPIVTPKFYFFDMGVVRALRRLKSIDEANTEYGEFFEHFIFLELKAWVDYRSPRTALSYWRSTSGFEVDFILDDSIAIEVKASKNITEKHYKGLRAIGEEKFIKRRIVVCREDRPRLVDGIHVMPWRMFLEELWEHGL